MYVKVIVYGTGGGQKFSIRCPNCRQIGTFEPTSPGTDIHVPGHWLGLRRCPNPVCHAALFFIANDSMMILRSYPPLRIDFDPKNIPARILATLSEAVACHAEKCYVASAMMIRRCLEELCEDRGAKGATLNDRILALKTKIVVPDELFEAMDELRLLGNDAAHVEAKVYDSIGESEVDLGLALTKEILKAVYQLDDLVTRLRALKKSP